MDCNSGEVGVTPMDTFALNTDLAIGTVRGWQLLFSDSKDHFLLELAVTAKAKTIVTGDSGIVGLIKYGEITFQTPEEFCEEMRL
ncbi:hypothetical protein WDW37_16300 [Bdellovibrionota bacterium FG-1]